MVFVRDGLEELRALGDEVSVIAYDGWADRRAALLDATAGEAGRARPWIVPVSLEGDLGQGARSC